MMTTQRDTDRPETTECLPYAPAGKAQPVWRLTTAVLFAVFGLVALFAQLMRPQLNTYRTGAMPALALAIVSPTGPLASAIEKFRFDTGQYPKALADINARRRPDYIAPEDWRGPYIEDPGSLKDPWGSAYRYRCPGTHNKNGYDLWSVGLDRVSDTEDDLTNWTKGN